MTSNRLPSDYNARLRAVDPTVSCVVDAKAGSGKTSVLLVRLLKCLAVSQQPEHVLAITFTNEAANEILARATSVLVEARKANPDELTDSYEDELIRCGLDVIRQDDAMEWSLTDNPSRLRILTFDKFSAMISRKLPLLSGLGSGEVVENPDGFYENAVIDTFSEIENENTPTELKSALSKLYARSNNRLDLIVPLFKSLLGKRDQWAEQVLNFDAEYTNDLLSSIVLNEYESLWAEFKSVAGEDIIHNLASATTPELSPWINDLDPSMPIDPETVDIIRKTASLFITAKGTLRKNVDKRSGFPPKDSVTDAMKAFLSEMKGSDILSDRLASICEKLSTLPDAMLDDKSIASFEDVSIILRYLLASLKVQFDHEGKVDFTEVSLRALSALGNHNQDEYGDALLDEDKVNHILVDEMQDTSLSQYELLSRICANWPYEEGKSIFFCGDALQSIYKFRGATPSLFKDLISSPNFNEMNLETLTLTQNFRSSPTIVDWVNKTISKISPPVLAADGSYKDCLNVEAFSDKEGSVEIVGNLNNDQEEAVQVVDSLKAYLSEYPDNSVAILVRSRNHLSGIIPLLKEEGISYSGRDIDLLKDTLPVIDAVGLIKSLYHDADKFNWSLLLRSRFIGLSWEDMVILCQDKPSLRDSIFDASMQKKLSEDGQLRLQRLISVLNIVERDHRSESLGWAAKSVWHSLNADACITDKEKVDVNRVFTLLEAESTGSRTFSMTRFDELLAKLYATPKSGKVTLMTIHKSKGLEFDSVFLTGFGRSGHRDRSDVISWKRYSDAFIYAPKPDANDEEDGSLARLFNYIESKNKDEVREERLRLIYVAITRAKSHLKLFLTARESGIGAMPSSNSLLLDLWPSVKGSFEGLVSTAMDLTDSNIKMPTSRVIDPAFSVSIPSLDTLFTNTNLKTVNSEINHLTSNFSENERIEGIVLHRVLERIGIEGLESWSNERVELLGQSLKPAFRRLGYPELMLSKGISKVISQVANMMTSDFGKWVLRSKTGGCELSLSSIKDNTLRKFILDRMVVEDNTCWIIDYKTAECPDNKEMESFLGDQTRKYKKKMNEYFDTVTSMNTGMTVKAGLYFPAHDIFKEVA